MRAAIAHWRLRSRYSAPSHYDSIRTAGCVRRCHQIAKGWQRERRSDGEQRKTFCFSEVGNAEWQGGTIRIQMSVFPRPGGVTEEWATAPVVSRPPKRGSVLMSARDPTTGEPSNLGFVDDCCVMEASQGTLIASVDLLTVSGEKPQRLNLRPNRAGDAMYEWLDDMSVADKPYQVNVQVRLTFKPPQKPAPVERSFWNEFLPGGRPESNRRKF